VLPNDTSEIRAAVDVLNDTKKRKEKKKKQKRVWLFWYPSNLSLMITHG